MTLIFVKMITTHNNNYCPQVGDIKSQSPVCPSICHKNWLISSEVLMIEHWYLACMILVTSPFYWYHAVTLTFDLLQGQICCRAWDHNSWNLLVPSNSWCYLLRNNHAINDARGSIVIMVCLRESVDQQFPVTEYLKNSSSQRVDFMEDEEG